MAEIHPHLFSRPYGATEAQAVKAAKKARLTLGPFSAQPTYMVATVFRDGDWIGKALLMVDSTALVLPKSSGNKTRAKKFLAALDD